jgi:hypothetical protein
MPFELSNMVMSSVIYCSNKRVYCGFKELEEHVLRNHLFVLDTLHAKQNTFLRLIVLVVCLFVTSISKYTSLPLVPNQNSIWSI